MINKIYVDRDAELTESDVIEFVMNFDSSADLARLNTLEKYFRTQNTGILNRQVTNGVDNAKIASGYCRYITNTINGYFLGSKESVVYSYPEGFDDSKLTDLFRYNDERAINNKLGENMSVYGYAIEQIYIDELGNFRFASISPKNVIVLFEDNIDQDIHSVIKYRATYLAEEEITRYVVDYYTKDKIYTWVYHNGLFVAEEAYEMDNIFSDVPFIYYENANEMGDFESVLHMVDAYDRTLSDMSNLFDYFNDALN